MANTALTCNLTSAILSCTSTGCGRDERQRPVRHSPVLHGRRQRQRPGVPDLARLRLISASILDPRRRPSGRRFHFGEGFFAGAAAGAAAGVGLRSTARTCCPSTSESGGLSMTCAPGGIPERDLDRRAEVAPDRDGESTALLSGAERRDARALGAEEHRADRQDRRLRARSAASGGPARRRRGGSRRARSRGRPRRAACGWPGRSRWPCARSCPGSAARAARRRSGRPALRRRRRARSPRGTSTKTRSVPVVAMRKSARRGGAPGVHELADVDVARGDQPVERGLDRLEPDELLEAPDVRFRRLRVRLARGVRALAASTSCRETASVSTSFWSRSDVIFARSSLACAVPRCARACESCWSTSGDSMSARRWPFFTRAPMSTYHFFT